MRIDSEYVPESPDPAKQRLYEARQVNVVNKAHVMRDEYNQNKLYARFADALVMQAEKEEESGEKGLASELLDALLAGQFTRMLVEASGNDPSYGDYAKRDLVSRLPKVGQFRILPDYINSDLANMPENLIAAFFNNHPALAVQAFTVSLLLLLTPVGPAATAAIAISSAEIISLLKKTGTEGKILTDVVVYAWSQQKKNGRKIHENDFLQRLYCVESVRMVDTDYYTDKIRSAMDLDELSLDTPTVGRRRGFFPRLQEKLIN